MEETMFVPRQQYPRELKIATMRELDSGKSMAEVARMYQVSPNRLEAWRGEWRAKGELAFPGHCARPQSKLDAERIRHGRKLATDCVQSEEESAIGHGPENAAEAPRAYNAFSANGNNPLNAVSQSSNGHPFGAVV
jgi:transposase-like protein